jgi:hypothetical protein
MREPCRLNDRTYRGSRTSTIHHGQADLPEDPAWQATARAIAIPVLPAEYGRLPLTEPPSASERRLFRLRCRSGRPEEHPRRQSATFGVYHAASPGFRIINCWLASQGKVPWRFTHFLDDAHQKTVLHQAGASYEFRHVILRDRLAARLEKDQ